MKRILLTTDFSDNAQAAIEYGLQLFGSENVSYTLLNTYKEPGTSTAAMVSIVEYLHKESEEMLHKAVASLKSSFPQHNIEPQSIHGSLYVVVNSLVKKGTVDTVVVGTRGASQVANFFLGSNTMDLLRNSEAPTVVVPKDYSYQKVNNIALALDLKPLEQLNILDPLIELAEIKDATISSFHIQEKEDDAMDPESPSIQRLTQKFGDVSHTFENVKNENVAAGIGSFVVASNADLLAIVARKHNFLERLFQKSITKEVSLMASFPLFVLPE